MRLPSFVLGLAVVLALSPGCDCDDDAPPPGTTPGMDSGTTTGGDGSITGSLDSPFTVSPGGEVLCGDTPCACDDGMDNDGDGTVDGLDAECTGPYDNDEGTFATGIPGDNRDPYWQDCFFDGNSGGGDDGCRYNTCCLYADQRDNPDCADRGRCDVSDMCRTYCLARTPSGCDCFGCCNVPTADGGSVSILIGGTCDLENIADETACPRCVQTPDCMNECGTCELCVGRTVADLPPECTPDAGTPMYTCDTGTVCMTDAECPMDYFCQLGCCAPFII